MLVSCSVSLLGHSPFYQRLSVDTSGIYPKTLPSHLEGRRKKEMSSSTDSPALLFILLCNLEDAFVRGFEADYSRWQLKKSATRGTIPLKESRITPRAETSSSARFHKNTVGTRRYGHVKMPGILRAQTLRALRAIRRVTLQINWTNPQEMTTNTNTRKNKSKHSQTRENNVKVTGVPSKMNESMPEKNSTHACLSRQLQAR